VHASKSAWVGWAADASAATANELTMTANGQQCLHDPSREPCRIKHVPAMRLSAAKSPLDRRKEVGLEPAIRPDARLVPEGRVDDAAGPTLGPRERVVTIGNACTADVDGAWIELSKT